MSEAQEGLQAQVDAPSVEQYPHLMEHEVESAGALLAGFPGWFKGAAGLLEVHLTYWLHAGGVLFVAVIVHPSGSVRPWLRHWSSHIEAMRSAENLAGEAEAYLRQMTSGHPMRETEDLGYDDLIDHLRTRMNGEFH